MEENFVKLFGHIIVSIIFSLVILRIGKRSFDSFYYRKPFPFQGTIEPILLIAEIHIWSFVCAFFIGSPILLLSLNSLNNIGTFIAIVFFIISSLRILIIISNRHLEEEPRGNHHLDFCKDLITWLFIASGLIFFIYITDFSYFKQTFETVINVSPQYLYFYPLILFIGAFFVSVSVELLGWGIISLERLRNR